MNVRPSAAPSPWGSICALLGLGIFLAYYIFSATPPGPNIGEQRSERLIDAVRSRDSASVTRLLAQGAEPNIGERYGRPSRRGASLLALAAAQDDLPTMEALVAHGADVNALREGVDFEERWRAMHNQQNYAALDELELTEQTTPLMEATLHDNLSAVRLLLSHGASVKVRNDSGVTALMFAARYARPQVVQTLLAHGADVNASDDQGHTPFSVATTLCQAEVASILQAHGAWPGAGPKSPVLPGHEGGAAYAVPIPNARDSFLPTLWVSPTQILCRRSSPEQFFLCDIRTGIETPLPKLTASWGHPIHRSFGDTFRLSPDGRWLLANFKGGWQACSIREGELRRWPRGFTPKDRIEWLLDWLPDGRHWVSYLRSFPGKPVEVYSLDSPKTEGWPVRPKPTSGYSIGGFEGHLCWNELRSINKTQAFLDPRKDLHAVHCGLVADKRTRTFRVISTSAYPELPSERYYACAWSPRGDRVAWLSDSGEICRITVSHADGRSRRMVFETSSNRPIYADSLGWTPDGRDLYFTCEEVLYTVPVRLSQVK